MSYELKCKRVRESHAAVLIQDEDGNDVWFPHSQVEEMHFDTNGAGMIVVTDWIAEQKGYQ